MPDFWKNLWGYIESLTLHDVLIVLAYLSAFVLVWFFTRWVFSRKLEQPPQTKAIVYALEAVFFTVFGLISYKYVEDPILKLLYRDAAVSITAVLLAKAVFSFGKISKWWQFLTYLGLFSALVVEIVNIFTVNITLVNVLIPLRKALILVALFPIVEVLLGFLPKRLGRVLKVFSTVLFLVVGGLWEFNKIDFDITAFIGLGIIIAATLVYSWFTTHGVVYLKSLLKRLEVSEDDTSGLTDALVKFGFLLLLLTYWEVGIAELHLGELVEKLKGWVVLNTSLIRISLYNLLVAVFLFFFLYYLINVLKKLLKLLFPPSEREDKGGSLEAVVYNLGMLLNATITLSALGLTWKAILPLAGALGIGLGFGLQTILNNYVSGFILMFSRNIKVGDFVELSGSAGNFINNTNGYIFGRVEDISILTTRIKTLDGIDVLVPNSTFIGNQIINYSLRNPYVRIRFPFGVAYSSDPERVKEILLKLAYDCPWAKNFYRPPQVWFTELGDSALIFELRLWVDIRELWRNPHAVKSFSLTDWIYTNGFKRLKEAGIEIPFPQNDVWFRNKLRVVVDRGED